ncbi:hypothetical protein V6N13_000714 [Hibiscus sabdariffa]
MISTSSEATNPLSTASSSTFRLQVKLHLSLHSWLLAKATIRCSLKGPTSGSQRLYLRIYDVEGRMEPCVDVNGPCRVGGTLRGLAQLSAFARVSPPPPKALSKTSSDYPTTSQTPSSRCLHFFWIPNFVASAMCGRFDLSSRAVVTAD